MEINRKKSYKMIRYYVQDILGYKNANKEIKQYGKRIFKMYLKEYNHLMKMNKKVKNLEPFKKTYFGKTYSNEDYNFKNEEEVVKQVIDNVNNIFKSIKK